MNKQQLNNKEHKSIRIKEQKTYALVLLCTYALLFAGCAKPYRGETTEQVSVSDISKAETMELAEEVLAELHFVIDKADVPGGLIRTRPLPGAQFFEFWRGDNVGPDSSLQANLHTIRRTVELNVTEQDGGVRIDCNVRVQRLSMPEREITSSARAYDMFSRSSPSLQRLTLNPEQEKAAAWIDLRKDTLLATEILRRIEKRIASRTNDEPQATRDRT